MDNPYAVVQLSSETEDTTGSPATATEPVAGDNAGVVMVVSEAPPEELCRRYGYELTAVRGEPLGVRIIGE